ncbi:hypothetical protein GGTG_11058 [Gaeumannomyces tritici R3-111a-1]|uniref:Uncharacterized protein n=1 Tax=Gaeumannomyces tritici (strain R3-111a-1) TaxID=644352 RepID=J3PC35_GAET3|nr:hypothetical protein GGTG_11058 [Gaeumannomyces tritici R3-111a-1]EJT71805.1 hypothetical protein GGTG_11058 [Gaeumannomyces tritici R3-111a-1]
MGSCFSSGRRGSRFAVYDEPYQIAGIQGAGIYEMNPRQGRSGLGRVHDSGPSWHDDHRSARRQRRPGGRRRR